MWEVGADPLVLFEAQYAVLPGETIDCLLVSLHASHRLQLLIQYEYTPIGQSHCQQGLTLDRAESQSQWDVVHPAAYHLSDGSFTTCVQVHLSGDRGRSEVPKHRQTPRDLQYGRILALSVAGVEWLAILFLCLCGVEENFSVGVAGSEEVALVVVLLVQNDAFVAVGVVEQWTHRRLLL